MSYRVGVDTGGTFTDLVAVDESSGEVATVKVSSTPDRPEAAVFEALHRAGLSADAIEYFVLGTTIATNCLLERKGVRTLYLTTAGFEDVPFIQRVDRRSLYDLQWQKPEPYVARHDCFGVVERIRHDGSVHTPLAGAEVARVLKAVRQIADGEPGGISCAVNFLFAYVNSEHEQTLAEALREALPDTPISVSSEVAPIWREYERANTVIVDAYVRRLVGGFAAELDTGLAAREITCPRFLLKSNGGQVPTAAADRQPVNFTLSGLAGGIIGGKHFADQVGAENVVTLDMGGTSADVGVVVDGQARSSSLYEFEWGLPIAIPVIDLTTIGAGGSSLASFDRGGFLTVGPESAGANPGPAADGLGSGRATVTDANLVLGRLNADFFLGGELSLDRARAEAAVAEVAERLDTGLEECALAIVEVATQNMANAIRLLCADRGLDYRRFDLEAFGGAGPLHGALLARRVGLGRVIVPPSPGLTSAYGAQAADLRVDRRLTSLLGSDVASDEELGGAVARIGDETLSELRAEGVVREPLLLVTISARYRGQNFELEIPVPPDSDRDVVARVVARFHAEHERVYGYRFDGAAVEFVHLNATAIDRRPSLPPAHLEPGSAADPVEVRPVFFRASGWTDTPIYRRPTLPAGATIEGPAVVEEIDSTTVLLDGQACRVHATGTLVISERGQATISDRGDEEMLADA